jgi:hypothetical protein
MAGTLNPVLFDEDSLSSFLHDLLLSCGLL